MTIMMCTSFLNSGAQTLIPASSTEIQYPDASMTPVSLNLDMANTRFLSNFSYPGSGILAGSTIELTSWNDGADGGFSYGASTAGTYTGFGALTIPNSRDIQIGYMEIGAHTYIVAAYFDNTVQLYGYDLYTWDFMTNIVTKLYTAHFPDPNFKMPAYTPTTDYYPVIGATTPPPGGYPAPAMASTMTYNRISMDISQDASRIAIVLTDQANGYMYTAVGIIAVDTILFSPNLPSSPTTPAVSVAVITVPAPGTPYYHFPYPGAYSGSGPIYNYFDGGTGIYAQYDAGTGKYLYSYYPINLGIYITEYDPTAGTIEQFFSTTSNLPYSPLIRLKGVSTSTTPCLNPYYKQYWPDVAFSGTENIGYVFYSPELNDLYVCEPSGSYPTFSDFYSFTGGSIDGYLCTGEAGITDFAINAINTGDARPISSEFISGAGHVPSTESFCQSLPLTSTWAEIRAKMDVPDLPSTDWAITFAYKPESSVFTGLFFPWPYVAPTSLVSVHTAAEDGKNNVYVRSNFVQNIMNNGSLGNMANNLDKNIAPTIAYGTGMTANHVAVAWASEYAGAAHSTAWGYIAVEMNAITSTRTSANDYFLLAANPNLDCGGNPLVALSKHNDGLNDVYSNFTQEDAMGTYSVQHKDHPWTLAPISWRQADPNAKAPLVEDERLSVAPNPFTNTLHVSSGKDISVQLTDILGRRLAAFSGTSQEVNKQLDNKAAELSSGTYLLSVQSMSGKSDVFKLTKE